MQQIAISILRDRNCTLEQYRQAADQLATALAIESSTYAPKTKVSLETPLAPSEGVRLKGGIVLVPILRSGLILLSPFLHFYPQAHIGLIGMRRNETTAIAELYYSNLPLLSAENSIFLLDPMVATGGSAALAIEILKKAGASESQITLAAFLAAPEGIARLKKEHPAVGLIVSQVDQGLNRYKQIIPGIGDFGDRYFGTNTLSTPVDGDCAPLL